MVINESKFFQNQNVMDEVTVNALKNFILNAVTMTNLEEFSSKMEMLAKLAAHINDFVWQKQVAEDDETLFEIGSLKETLADLIASYDGKLNAIIENIKKM